MRGRWNAITIIRIHKYNVSVVLVQPQSKSWARRSCTKTKQSFYSQQVTLQHVAAKIVRGTFYHTCMLILFIICGRVARAGYCGHG